MQSEGRRDSVGARQAAGGEARIAIGGGEKDGQAAGGEGGQAAEDESTTTEGVPLSPRARHNLLAAGEALERADLLAAVRQAADKGAETCAICCEPFRHGQRVILLLCQHEFHPECARKAALSDFAQTREFPRCALCREPMRQHV